MRLCRGVLLALAALALVPPSSANDTLVTLAAGGLVPLKSSEIVMESEDLQISARRIVVKYIFRNISDRDIDAVVAFPLPELDGGTVYNAPFHAPTKDPINFVGFQATVDGKPVDAKLEIRAFKNKREITARLRADGLPLSVLDPRFDRAVRALPVMEQRRLQTDELVLEDESHDQPGGPLVKRYWPWWNTRLQYYWTQHFPSKAQVEVQHTYHPVAGGSYISTGDDGAASIKPYCGNSVTLSQIRRAQEHFVPKDQSDIVLWERRVHYILTTANNWSGPIGHFRLLVVTNPDDILATCSVGLKRVGPGRYESVRSDFRPNRELELLILVTHRPTAAE